MNIRFTNCPNEIANSLAAAVTPGLRTKANLPGITMVAGQAHEVYYVAPRDLIEDQSLAKARRVAWRMTHTGANRAVAAEVDVSVRPHNTEVTSINEGPFAAEPDTQLTKLQTSTDAGSYELRVLRIPEIYLMATWLHSSDSDLVIPSAPAPSGLIAGQEYSLTGL